MKMNNDQKILYDFFCQVGVLNNSVDYPLILLNAWANADHESVVADFDKKGEVLDAYNHCILHSTLDKPLYEAIKTLKGWK